MMRHSIFIILIGLSFWSCEKGEIPVQPFDRGDAIANHVATTVYANQLYFDFETNQFVKKNQKIDWDLGFGSGAFDQSIFTNTAKSMAVAQIPNANFDAVSTIDNLDFIYESSTGHLDSTAFPNWSTNDLFVVDLGYDDLGNHQGYGKIKIIENTATIWKIAYGFLAETSPTEISITKDLAYNATFFSFKTKSVVSIEPPNTDWDICFTQYIHYFHEHETPYLVSGVLINRYAPLAYQHSTEDFTAITFDDIDVDDLTTNIDAIGYDWKAYIGGNYTVYPEQNFILKTQEGYYYKLHFTDFYNELGEKGYPKFEFQAL